MPKLSDRGLHLLTWEDVKRCASVDDQIRADYGEELDEWSKVVPPDPPQPQTLPQFAPATTLSISYEALVDRWLTGRLTAPQRLSLKVRRYQQLAEACRTAGKTCAWLMSNEMNAIYDGLLEAAPNTLSGAWLAATEAAK